MKTVILSSNYFLLLYNIAEIEAMWHAEALSKYIDLDEISKNRLLKLLFA